MACTIDFCRLDEGFGGKTYKRKRNPQSTDEDASIFGGAAMDIDDSYPPPAKRSAAPSSDNPDKPIFGKPSYDGVIAGKVSGRKWKQPAGSGAFDQQEQEEEEQQRRRID